MVKGIRHILAWVEARITLVQAIAGSGVVSTAVITGWIASITGWISAYGPIGWWAAGLVGGLVAAILACLLAFVRRLWINASAIRAWQEKVDTINPLDPEFHKKVIRFEDVCHPVNRKLSNKKFFDCELLGPANILAVRNNTIHVNSLNGCDFVILKNAPMTIYNAIPLENVEIMGGSIWNCTVFIPHEMAEGFYKKGARFITLAGFPDIDSDAVPLDPNRPDAGNIVA